MDCSMMLRISKELKKLKAREESSTSAAETISIGLCGISDLYKCIADMLSSPLTQQSLPLHQHVDELLEVSSKLLEVCSSTRDMAFQMKQASEDLRSDLGVSNQHSSILSFICSRKKIVKGTKQILLSLKRIGGVGISDECSAAIQALRCVSIISSSILETLLLFLGSQPKCGGRRSLFSKLINKGRRLCEDEVGRNELENVDVSICRLAFQNDENIRLARKKLEALSSGIEGIESGLDSLFKQLTQVRVLLLEINSS